MNTYAAINFYDLSIAANTARKLDAAGSLFRYVSGDAGGADTRILVRPIGGQGGAVLLSPGQAVKFPYSVSEWRIENYANAGTITGTVAVGDGDLQDNRITGEVSVVEGGRARVVAGLAFMGATGAAAVAAQYSHAQLWNASSTYRLVVNKLVVSTSPAAPAGAFINVARNAAALFAGPAAPSSKLVNGTASVNAELRGGTNAALLGTTMVSFWFDGQVLQQIPLVEPIIIPPGAGLVLAMGVVNQQLNVQFDHWEDRI